MEAIVEALTTAPGPFRPLIDGRSLTGDPFDPARAPVVSDVALMAGCTDTETTWYLRADVRNFALDFADGRRRLERLLKQDDARIDAIVGPHRAALPAGTPSDLLVAVTTDYLFKRNTLKIAVLHAASGGPTYAYNFARKTPVEGGRLRSSHSSDVPFIFGTTAAAAACVGEGPDVDAMTDCMMGAWASFARSGDPNNLDLPP
jgi:para-nitrobenzyl esterase